jgi:hypothetical protein
MADGGIERLEPQLRWPLQRGAQRAGVWNASAEHFLEVFT